MEDFGGGRRFPGCLAHLVSQPGLELVARAVYCFMFIIASTSFDATANAGTL